MMRPSGWLGEQQAAEQRRFTNLLVGSFVAHFVFVALLAIAPTPDLPILENVLTVDLVALPAPAAPSPKAPAPAPAPRPAPPPVPKKIVLPKQAPKAIPKKRVAPPAPPKRPEPIEYDDALSQLRNELGETAPVDPPLQAEISDTPAPEAVEPGGQTAGEVSAWKLAILRHVRTKYITPPEFLNRSLVTGLEVVLTSRGELVGTPRVVQPSGDPFFDDNAIRAVMMAAPLPAPPEPGAYVFRMNSEDR